jgi:predicted anti-sigma-YlaC factor YlaD
MVERCSFDEALLSAYLDDELTQEESQRVRLHLEECASCRATFEGMKEIREATMTTPFATFDDGQWDERPRGPLSRLLRGGGWALLLIWILGVSYIGLREVSAGPSMTGPEILLVFGLVGGGVLLFLSVLIDRLQTYKTDRYRRVQK